MIAAHVQEPGANDNASGVATLAELAVSLAAAIKSGKVPPPGRTLTFLFLDRDQREPPLASGASGRRETREVHVLARHDGRGRRQDRRQFSDRASSGSRRRLGSTLGSALGVGARECPGRTAQRRSDQRPPPCRVPPRCEEDRLGRQDESVRGRQRSHGVWQRRHAVVAELALHRSLLPHELRYAGQDEPGRDEECRRCGGGFGVAAGVGRTTRRRARSWMWLSAAGRSRLEQEITAGAKIAAADKDPAAAQAREATIVAAWRKWYAQAVRSVRRLVVGPASVSLNTKIESVAASFEPGADRTVADRPGERRRPRDARACRGAGRQRGHSVFHVR